MHLSLLSETGISLCNADERAAALAFRANCRAHRDGLIRGLLFLAAIGLPLGLAIATGHAGQRDPSAGYAQSFDSRR